MDRLVLADGQWAKMEPHCLGKPSDPGRSGGNNRLFVEAVLWIARTGSPWRDLPAGVRQVEHGLQALPRLGEGRCVPAAVRGLLG
jgi:transposase